jgi:hypothetical protein
LIAKPTAQNTATAHLIRDARLLPDVAGSGSADFPCVTAGVLVIVEPP